MEEITDSTRLTDEEFQATQTEPINVIARGSLSIKIFKYLTMFAAASVARPTVQVRNVQRHSHLLRLSFESF